MKTRSILALLVPATLVTAAAWGDDKAACVAAASKGQTLRDAHKLIEARAELRACAAASCPAAVKNDCAGWLTDVDKALPSVVVTAKDPSGQDLVQVNVTVDGQPLLRTLDGHAVPMNAGPHLFHFDASGWRALDRQVVVREGEKNQGVAVVLAPSAAATTGGASPLRTVGWIAGGAGIAGLAVGTVAGIIAVGDKSSADCTGNVCKGSVSGVKSAALASDIGWIAGGALLAGGGAIVLFGPHGGREAGAAIGLTPVMTARGGELVVGGVW